VGVAVDEAGHHAAAARVDPVVGVHPGPLDGDHHPVFEDEGGVTELAKRSVAAETRIVGDQQADVVDREGAQRPSRPVPRANELTRPPH
jgi:hypothetical protein